MTRNNENIIKEHFEALKKRYPELKLKQDDNGIWFVYGNLKFRAVYEGEEITDEYEVNICLPKNYPESKPYAYETGGKIPKDFHKNTSGILCMDVPLEVQKKFATNPNLISFVENLLIHYLYSYSYLLKHGKTPWGEYSHFGKGLLEYYKKEFNIDDDFKAFHFVFLLAQKDIRGHYLCPCGSGNRLRNCVHWDQILKMSNEYGPDGFLLEYDQIIRYFKNVKKISVPPQYISKKIMKRYSKLSKDKENILHRNYK